MSYTLEDFKADHDLDQKTIDERKEQLLEEMRLYELKEARKRQDVTQKQLAERMGVSQKRVSSLESGASTKPKSALCADTSTRLEASCRSMWSCLTAAPCNWSEPKRPIKSPASSRSTGCRPSPMPCG